MYDELFYRLERTSMVFTQGDCPLIRVHQTYYGNNYVICLYKLPFKTTSSLRAYSFINALFAKSSIIHIHTYNTIMIVNSNMTICVDLCIFYSIINNAYNIKTSWQTWTHIYTYICIYKMKKTYICMCVLQWLLYPSKVFTPKLVFRYLRTDFVGVRILSITFLMPSNVKYTFLHTSILNKNSIYFNIRIHLLIHNELTFFPN